VGWAVVSLDLILVVFGLFVPTGITSGEVLFNNEPRNTTFFRESSYVKQEDIHIPILTVRETLRFAAKLRMGEVRGDDEGREPRMVHNVSLSGCVQKLGSDSGEGRLSAPTLPRKMIRPGLRRELW
jgi:ABC-type multidrug transport system ATPase subunit